MSIDKRYTLRVAVKLHGINSIMNLEAGIAFEIGEIRISLTKNEPFLVLKAERFMTEEDARRLLPYVQAGLWNLALEYNIAFIPDFEPRQITWSDDPNKRLGGLAGE